MKETLLTNWSCAIALLGWACTLTCVYRLWSAWHLEPDHLGRRMVLSFAALFAAGIAWSQTYAWVMWEWEYWKPDISPPFGSMPYRLAWTIALIGFGGRATWAKCGHWGWVGMCGIGVAGWLVAWAV